MILSRSITSTAILLCIGALCLNLPSVGVHAFVSPSNNLLGRFIHRKLKHTNEGQRQRRQQDTTTTITTQIGLFRIKSSLAYATNSTSASSFGGIEEEIPEKIVKTYQQWCKHFDKEFSQKRLPIFKRNFLQLEEYYNRTGIAVDMNEYADMERDEISKPDPIPPKKENDKDKAVIEAWQNMMQERNLGRQSEGISDSSSSKVQQKKDIPPQASSLEDQQKTTASIQSGIPGKSSGPSLSDTAGGSGMFGSTSASTTGPSSFSKPQNEKTSSQPLGGPKAESNPFQKNDFTSSETTSSNIRGKILKPSEDTAGSKGMFSGSTDKATAPPSFSSKPENGETKPTPLGESKVASSSSTFQQKGITPTKTTPRKKEEISKPSNTAAGSGMFGGSTSKGPTPPSFPSRPENRQTQPTGPTVGSSPFQQNGFTPPKTNLGKEETPKQSGAFDSGAFGGSTSTGATPSFPQPETGQTQKPPIGETKAASSPFQQNGFSSPKTNLSKGEMPKQSDAFGSGTFGGNTSTGKAPSFSMGQTQKTPIGETKSASSPSQQSAFTSPKTSLSSLGMSNPSDASDTGLSESTGGGGGSKPSSGTSNPMSSFSPGGPLSGPGSSSPGSSGSEPKSFKPFSSGGGGSKPSSGTSNPMSSFSPGGPLSGPGSSSPGSSGSEPKSFKPFSSGGGGSKPSSGTSNPMSSFSPGGPLSGPGSSSPGSSGSEPKSFKPFSSGGGGSKTSWGSTTNPMSSFSPGGPSSGPGSSSPGSSGSGPNPLGAGSGSPFEGRSGTSNPMSSFSPGGPSSGSTTTSPFSRPQNDQTTKPQSFAGKDQTGSGLSSPFQQNSFEPPKKKPSASIPSDTESSGMPADGNASTVTTTSLFSPKNDKQTQPPPQPIADKQDQIMKGSPTSPFQQNGLTQSNTKPSSPGMSKPLDAGTGLFGGSPNPTTPSISQPQNEQTSPLAEGMTGPLTSPFQQNGFTQPNQVPKSSTRPLFKSADQNVDRLAATSEMNRGNMVIGGGGSAGAQSNMVPGTKGNIDPRRQQQFQKSPVYFGGKGSDSMIIGIDALRPNTLPGMAGDSASTFPKFTNSTAAYLLNATNRFTKANVVEASNQRQTPTLMNGNAQRPNTMMPGMPGNVKARRPFPPQRTDTITGKYIQLTAPVPVNMTPGMLGSVNPPSPRIGSTRQYQVPYSDTNDLLLSVEEREGLLYDGRSNARQKFEEKARAKAAEDAARIQTEEDARRLKRERSKLHFDEISRKQAEEESARRVALEAEKKAKEAARRRAVELREAARIAAEQAEQAKIQAQLEARRRAEEQARLIRERNAMAEAEQVAANAAARQEARLRAKENARLLRERNAQKLIEEEVSRSLAEEVARQQAIENARRMGDLSGLVDRYNATAWPSGWTRRGVSASFGPTTILRGAGHNQKQGASTSAQNGPATFSPSNSVTGSAPSWPSLQVETGATATASAGSSQNVGTPLSPQNNGMQSFGSGNAASATGMTTETMSGSSATPFPSQRKIDGGTSTVSKTTQSASPFPSTTSQQISTPPFGSSNTESKLDNSQDTMSTRKNPMSSWPAPKQDSTSGEVTGSFAASPTRGNTPQSASKLTQESGGTAFGIPSTLGNEQSTTTENNPTSAWSPPQTNADAATAASTSSPLSGNTPPFSSRPMQQNGAPPFGPSSTASTASSKPSATAGTNQNSSPFSPPKVSQTNGGTPPFGSSSVSSTGSATNSFSSLKPPQASSDAPPFGSSSASTTTPASNPFTSPKPAQTNSDTPAFGSSRKASESNRTMQTNGGTQPFGSNSATSATNQFSSPKASETNDGGMPPFGATSIASSANPFSSSPKSAQTNDGGTPPFGSRGKESVSNPFSQGGVSTFGASSTQSSTTEKNDVMNDSSFPSNKEDTKTDLATDSSTKTGSTTSSTSSSFGTSSASGSNPFGAAGPSLQKGDSQTGPIKSQTSPGLSGNGFASSEKNPAMMMTRSDTDAATTNPLTGNSAAASVTSSFSTSSGPVEAKTGDDEDNNDDVVVPDHIRQTYVDWCSFYGVEFDNEKLKKFQKNFMLLEDYFNKTGIALEMDENADSIEMTIPPS